MVEMAKPLDEKTLEAIAELICGDSTVRYDREDEDLASFFRRAGLECLDPYYVDIPWGLTAPERRALRKQWTLERLKEYNSNPSEIGKVIVRLADPFEYPGKPELHQAVVARLNQILSPEGLEVYLEGVKPQIREISPTVPTPTPVNLEQVAFPDFKQLTSNEELGTILESRWKEATICIHRGAPLAAIILMGSILEGVLFAFVHKYPRQANQASAAPKDKSGKVKQFSEWTLSNLIDVAHGCGWIQRDAKEFTHTLREYRNFIHPQEQLARKEQPDVDTCRICLEVVRAAINDLATYAKSTGSSDNHTKEPTIDDISCLI